MRFYLSLILLYTISMKNNNVLIFVDSNLGDRISGIKLITLQNHYEEMYLYKNMSRNI